MNSIKEKGNEMYKINANKTIEWLRKKCDLDADDIEKYKHFIKAYWNFQMSLSMLSLK